MEKFKILQNALMHSSEDLINAEAEVRRYVELLAIEKQTYVAKKLMGRSFDKDELVSKDDYDYKSLPDGLMCVDVTYSVEQDLLPNIVGKEWWRAKPVLFTLKLTFMGNPYDVADKKITRAELEKLKVLRRFYGKVCPGELLRKFSDTPDIWRVNNDLRNLKNQLNFVTHLTWSYDLENITNANFVVNGLRAYKKALFL